MSFNNWIQMAEEGAATFSSVPANYGGGAFITNTKPTSQGGNYVRHAWGWPGGAATTKSVVTLLHEMPDKWSINSESVMIMRMHSESVEGNVIYESNQSGTLAFTVRLSYLTSTWSPSTVTWDSRPPSQTVFDFDYEHTITAFTDTEVGDNNTWIFRHIDLSGSRNCGVLVLNTLSGVVATSIYGWQLEIPQPTMPHASVKSNMVLYEIRYNVPTTVRLDPLTITQS